MLRTEDINSIATMLKIDAEKFKAIVSSDKEEEITDLKTDLKVFTSEELETRIKNENAPSYREGKKAGIEMDLKAKREELGYPNDGSLKTLNDFIEFHDGKLKDKYSKGNTERVTELENDIQKLNQNHVTAIQELEGQNARYVQEITQKGTTNKLLSMMPKETVIPGNDIITIFNAHHAVELQDGKEVVKVNGEVVKDPTTAEALPLSDIFTNFIAERKFSTGDPGRGGKDQFGKNGKKFTSIAAFQDNWISQGKSIQNAEYDGAYAKWREENKEVTA